MDFSPSSSCLVVPSRQYNSVMGSSSPLENPLSLVLNVQAYCHLGGSQKKLIYRETSAMAEMWAETLTLPEQKDL